MKDFRIRDDIELRQPAEQDAPEIFELVKENLEHLQPFIHWANEDYSLQSAREFIERNEKSVAEKKGETFAIFRNGKIIGMIGFVGSNQKSRRTEIGYWISREHEGANIIFESCAALVNYAFRELEMNRVEIRCATENTRSRRIPERLGFRLEGVLRQSEWRHTRFYDQAIYGLLAEEWNRRGFTENAEARTK